MKKSGGIGVGFEVGVVFEAVGVLFVVANKNNIISHFGRKLVFIWSWIICRKLCRSC